MITLQKPLPKTFKNSYQVDIKGLINYTYLFGQLSKDIKFDV